MLGSPGGGLAGWRLCLEGVTCLLQAKFPAVGDPAIERYRREIRTMLSLVLGPRRDARNHGANAADHIQRRIVSAYHPQPHPIPLVASAQSRQREEALKIICGYCVALQVRHFKHLV
jgi:hypothetical protein